MNNEGLKIISGGQTGADRAALDWAIKNGVAYSGWCPKGRKAEDGPIDLRYKLQETPRADYLQRTEWNVRDSDATVIFTLAEVLSGGSKRTAEFADKHKKPCIHLSGFAQTDAADKLKSFIVKHDVRVLNVAGTRGSKEPGVGVFVERILNQGIDFK
jgi:hypothetical protein